MNESLPVSNNDEKNTLKLEISPYNHNSRSTSPSAVGEQDISDHKNLNRSISSGAVLVTAGQNDIREHNTGCLVERDLAITPDIQLYISNKTSVNNAVDGHSSIPKHSPLSHYDFIDLKKRSISLTIPALSQNNQIFDQDQFMTPDTAFKSEISVIPTRDSSDESLTPPAVKLEGKTESEDAIIQPVIANQVNQLYEEKLKRKYSKFCFRFENTFRANIN